MSTPSTTAVSPSSLMRAPSRASSCTCMKRFSKIVSVMRETPRARVISAMNCACRSVGKPGNGAVEMSTGPMPAPLRVTRTPRLSLETFAPGARQRVERLLEQVGADAFEQNVAAGHRHRGRIGARFDAVGQHAMARAVEPRDAGDLDRRGARALDPRAHLVEAVGEVLHFRLARRVARSASSHAPAPPPSSRRGCRRPSPWEIRSRRRSRPFGALATT